MHKPDDLVTFWFGSLTNGLADDAHRSRWFQPDKAFDLRCEQLWAPLLAPARQGELVNWLDTPAGRLAFVLLCDQIPRNVYRGTADAYGWDDLALAAARDGVLNGDDRSLDWDERCFLYMPFEHSENLLDQHAAVGLFSALRDQSSKEIRNVTGNYLRYAQQHRDIVLQFGRFPHRNAVLGRTSSAAEARFVAAGDGFGQTR